MSSSGAALLGLGAVILTAASASSGSSPGSGGGSPPPPVTANAGALEFLCTPGQINHFLAMKDVLRSGDRFALSSGNWGSAPSVSDLNAWQKSLSELVSGLYFSAHTGGQANVEKITPGLDPEFTDVDFDWEPNEPKWVSTEAGTIEVMKEFVDYIHSRHKLAVPYLTGRGLEWGWNYARILSESGADRMIVQTQGQVSGGTGPAFLKTLLDQGVPGDKLTVQATVGARGTTNDQVCEMYNAAASQSVHFFLEFIGDGSALVSVLKQMGR